MKVALTLTDSLNQYLASLKSNAPAEAQAELHRFARWAGVDRSVESLAPPEVARYAEEVAAVVGDTSARLRPVKEFLAFLKKQGVVAQSLASHMKVPKGAARQAGQRRPGEAPIQMTAQGREALERELKELKGQREGVAKAIGTAAADKDFRENAPLDAAREKQGLLEGRVREIEEMLRRSVVVEAHGGSISQAQVGRRVVLQDLSSGKRVTYTLVDSAEADPLNGKLSVVSPVGQAVVGHAPGDEVEVVAPKGTFHYRVVAVKR